MNPRFTVALILLLGSFLLVPVQPLQASGIYDLLPWDALPPDQVWKIVQQHETQKIIDAAQATIDATAPSQATMAAGVNLNITCVSCPLFNALHDTALTVTARIYSQIGNDAGSLLRLLATLYLLWCGARLGIGLAGADLLPKIAMFAILLFVSSIILTNYDLFQYWVVSPIQDTALKLALAIVSAVGQIGAYHDAFSTVDTTVANAKNGYSALIAIVEAQVHFIIVWVLSLGSWDPFKALAGMALMLPYLFVICIFVAFMIEAFFSFTAVSFIAPLLVMSVSFPATRSFAIAGLRIIIGAALSIIFAASAMALTVGVVDNFIQGVANKYGLTVSTGSCLINNACLSAIADVVTLDKNFFVFFIMGFISVLLHLKSKSLASNLSGANDGAGPAAATVAAGKMVLFAGASAGAKIATGQGGLGGIAKMMSGTSGAQGFRQAAMQHGAVGAVAHALTSPFARQTPPPQSGGSGFNDNVGFSTGGNNAGGGVAGMSEKQMRSFASMIGEAVNGGKPGRTRQGGGGS